MALANPQKTKPKFQILLGNLKFIRQLGYVPTISGKEGLFRRLQRTLTSSIKFGSFVPCQIGIQTRESKGNIVPTGNEDARIFPFDKIVSRIIDLRSDQKQLAISHGSICHQLGPKLFALLEGVNRNHPRLHMTHALKFGEGPLP